MKLHSLAEEEAPGQTVVADLPFFGKPRLHGQILAALCQALIDVTQMRIGGRLVERIGIEQT